MYPQDFGTLRSPSEAKEALVDRCEQFGFEHSALHVIKATHERLIDRYVQTEFNHITNAKNTEQILSEGLRAGGQLIQKEDAEFFLSALLEFHGHAVHPADLQFAQSHILGESEHGRHIFAMAGDPDAFEEDSYLVPESLKYFMRNLKHFADRQEGLADMANEALEKVHAYWQPYKGNEEGHMTGSVLGISPFSPMLARAVISQHDFSRVDIAVADMAMNHILQNRNIGIQAPISAEDIVLKRQFVRPESEQVDYIFDNDAMSVFIPR